MIESSLTDITTFSSSGWLNKKESDPGATNKSGFTDSAIGQLACAKYDSRRLVVMKSEIPAAMVV